MVWPNSGEVSIDGNFEKCSFLKKDYFNNNSTLSSFFYVFLCPS